MCLQGQPQLCPETSNIHNLPPAGMKHTHTVTTGASAANFVAFSLNLVTLQIVLMISRTFRKTFLATFWTANSSFRYWGVGNTDWVKIALQKTSGVLSPFTLAPTPGRVRSASRACTYGTVRRPSSHCIPRVLWICFALCCRNRALYPKPRSLRSASVLLPGNYNAISNTATVMACLYFMLAFIHCN